MLQGEHNSPLVQRVLVCVCLTLVFSEAVMLQSKGMYMLGTDYKPGPLLLRNSMFTFRRNAGVKAKTAAYYIGSGLCQAVVKCSSLAVWWEREQSTLMHVHVSSVVIITNERGPS